VESFVGVDRLWKTPDMLKAEDVMSKKLVKIGPNRSVAHAIELMKEHHTNVLAVVEKVQSKPSKILGIVGLNRFKGVSDNATKMKDIMKTSITKIPHDMSLVDVLNIRKEKQLRYSPVVDVEGNIVGMITNTSIINVLTDIVPESEEY
jgi:osmoprotectant transport system ATP-binding protein